MIYSFYRLRRRRFKVRLIQRLLFLVIFGVLIYFGGKSLSGKLTSAATKPVASPKPSHSPLPSQPSIKVSASLQEAVQGALDGSHGTYGVVVKNLKTNEGYTLNEHQVFDSASLYKLWVMAKIYQEVQAGKLKEDDVLSQDVATLNEEFQIDPEDAEQTDGTITYSVDDALRKMITISDNYAALLLAEKLKLSTISTFLTDNDFAESKVGTDGDSPTATASDIALFFEKLYNGQLANAEYTQKMLDLLKAQALNDKIPENLPDNVQVAHKTGELDQYTHDAGIVYSPTGDYVIVIMSQSDAPELAKARLANISEAVYNYFNKG